MSSLLAAPGTERACGSRGVHYCPCSAEPPVRTMPLSAAFEWPPMGRSPRCHWPVGLMSGLAWSQCRCFLGRVRCWGCGFRILRHSAFIRVESDERVPVTPCVPVLRSIRTGDGRKGKGSLLSQISTRLSWRFRFKFALSPIVMVMHSSDVCIPGIKSAPNRANHCGWHSTARGEGGPGAHDGVLYNCSATLVARFTVEQLPMRSTPAFLHTLASA
jgi:hypothetical protein